MLKASCIALTLSLMTQPCHAAIIDMGDFLTDTNSRLDWLDVTKTMNMPFNYVSGQFGIGGQFEGWRYATGDEFNTLLSSWTGVDNNGYMATDTTHSQPSVDGLVTMLGSTLDSYLMDSSGETYDSSVGLAPGEAWDYTQGFIADDYGQFGYKYTAMIFDREAHSIPRRSFESVDFYTAHYSGADPSGSYNRYGSYLVRQSNISIPIANTLTLFLIGLCSLIYSKKNNKSM